MEIILVIVIIVLTAYIFIQRRRDKSAKKILQEELEEKLRLQDKILYEEKQRHRQDEMIRALSSDYRSVYYYNLDDDEGVCYRSRRNTHDENEIITPFSKMLEDYLNKSVVAGDLGNVLKFIKPEYLRERLRTEKIISYRYLATQNSRKYYEMIRIAKIDDNTEIHAVGVGFANVDEQTRETIAQNQILADALAQAQHANISKTTFLSNMSHDIRTPMNAIIGYTNLARREGVTVDEMKNL